jgi:putative Holliday junction resolvase
MTNRCVLALDLGEKRIGIAISDPDKIIAAPYGVIKHISRKIDAAMVLQIADDNSVNTIVIGQALGENGEETRQSRHAQRFMNALSEESNLTIALWDESYSTKTARMTRVTMGVNQKNRRGHLDDLAATIILQSYLEAHRELEN